MDNNYSRLIVTGDETLVNILKRMDELMKKLLLVFNKGIFVGLVSIGDIQRAIIKGLPLDTHINEILRAEYTYATSDMSEYEIKQMVLEKRTECMPVLDKNKNLVKVLFWEDLFPPEQKRNIRNLNIPVVIMAGGKGTRLKPITNVLPKPLIPIGERTILEIIMDSFVDVGCNDFQVSVNFKAEMIEHYFKDYTQYRINYFKEDKPLGTAGSLSLLKDKIKSTFFLSNCDIVVYQDFGELYDFHKENRNELTIVAVLKQYQIPYGTLETGVDGLLTGLTEKPEYTYKINSGLYILEPHLLSEIPANTFFHITELIDKILKRKGRVGVFPVSEKSWIDIGNWDSYLPNRNKAIKV